MPPTLPASIEFKRASKSSGKKYVAILPSGKTVQFGARGYEHYKDQVPKDLGGGKWSSHDHLDKQRRKNYRTRHAAIETAEGKPAYRVRYSPAWFSYYFLW